MTTARRGVAWRDTARRPAVAKSHIILAAAIRRDPPRQAARCLSPIQQVRCQIKNSLRFNIDTGEVILKGQNGKGGGMSRFHGLLTAPAPPRG